LAGCGGGDSGGGGGDYSGGGDDNLDCSVGVDLHEFRHLQFYVEGAGQNDSCNQRAVKIHEYELYREHDACYFTPTVAEEWIGGVWEGYPHSTTTFSIPTGSYKFCYERFCSGEWIHTIYNPISIDVGWDGQDPMAIKIDDNSEWGSGTCNGGGGAIPPETAAVLYIKNIGTYPISEVYISLSSSDGWGNNLIPEGKALPPGEQMPITINNCNQNYDFKVVHYVNGGIPQESTGNYVECGQAYTWGVGYGAEGTARGSLSSDPKNNEKQIQ